MQRSVVIVAGGSGSRMKSLIPKQFLEIEGKPVLVWTIQKFLDFDKQISCILVIPEEHISRWKELQKRFSFLNDIQHTTGGKSRLHSVTNGLKLINDNEIVAIHDAVRPNVSVDTIERCYKQAEKSGSAIPVVDSEDSLRIITADGNKIIDREKVKRIQTPQVFYAQKIKQAYSSITDQSFTDDASVYEAYYGKVDLVEGNRENIKITFPGDLNF